MRIGEIAQRSGFSRDTIRWYEKIGLIQLDKKARTENNYRIYTRETLQRLQLIKSLKTFGFTLKDIEILLWKEAMDDISCNSIESVFQNRLQKINEKIDALQTVKSKLLAAKESCSGNCCALIDR